MEMERDTLISHGATGLLLERMMESSDAYRTVWCTQCGLISEANVVVETIKCRKCGINATIGGNPQTFATLTIPYAYKTLAQTMIGAGLQFDFGLQKL